jgi:hypothetical protein
MMNTTEELTMTKSLQLLCDGFKNEFAAYVFAELQNTDLLQQLSSEFVESDIQIVDNEHQVELSMMLIETLDVIAQ